MRGGRSNQQSSCMRGVIVPPSKLIVKKEIPPKVVFLLGAFIIKGGRLITILLYIYIYTCNTIVVY